MGLRSKMPRLYLNSNALADNMDFPNHGNLRILSFFIHDLEIAYMLWIICQKPLSSMISEVVFLTFGGAPSSQ
jgi:hypothetical protein